MATTTPTTPTLPTVRPDDTVRVVNQESFPIPVKWNSRPYTLVPGVDSYIPAACAFLFFGDPRSSEKFQSIVDPDGTRMYVVDRATEVRRLRIKWGAELTGDEATFENVPIPTVEVYTLDGERIITVVEDPEGRSILPASTTQASDEELRALVQRQQRQLEALMRAQGLNEETERAAADEDELPTDGEVPGLSED